MASCVLRGRILLGSTLVPGVVVIEGDRIAGVERGRFDPPADVPVHDAAIIAPGFIDLQVNGGFGRAVEEGPEAIAELARQLPPTGVVAFLPTLVSATLETYQASRSSVAGPVPCGARPLGLHLEGPLLAPARPGAHRAERIVDADAPALAASLAVPSLRIMTLAPERPGAIELIRRLVERGVVVSLGHTDARFDELERGVDAGATMATHVFNAMAPFEHRAPNAVGAVLVDDRLTTGLIADGIHSHPAALDLVVRAKGVERVALVTDMAAAAGMGQGTYHLGDRQVESRNGAVRLDDGTLAGSVLTMDQAVRNIVRWTSAGVPDALRMAGEIPARVLGLSCMGRIAIGLDASLVLLDEHLEVQRTLVKGEWMAHDA